MLVYVRAMQQYKASQLDISRLGTTKGYEQFSEFGETLKRARNDPAYRPPGDKERTFDTQVSVVPEPIFSLNIIEMFKQKREWQGVTKGFESLVDRGDATAAQSLGIFHLNGQYGPRNPQIAFAWFYQAWALGDPEGINAIGVIWRDGAGVAPDKKLALASFAISRQMIFDKRSPAYQRINQNFSRISGQMQPNEISDAGCLKWEDIHQRFRQIAATTTTAAECKLLNYSAGHADGPPARRGLHRPRPGARRGDAGALTVVRLRSQPQRLRQSCGGLDPDHFAHRRTDAD